MRVTHHMLYRNFLFHLEHINENLKKDFEKIASGKKILRPSDDPFGMAKSLTYQRKLADIEQYKRNIKRAISWQNITEMALQEMTNLLVEAKEIAISQGSDTATSETRAMLAAHIEKLKEHALQIGNTKLGDQYVFAGYLTSTQPFVDTDNNYHGDNGQIKVNISSYMQLSFNIPGSIFTNGTNIFQALDDLKTALETNDADSIRNLIGTLDQAIKQVIVAHASLGSIMNRFEAVKTDLTSYSVELTAHLSETEDSDMAKVASSLATHQIIYQSTLAGMAKIMQFNLFNYLG
ncbi:MAG TPA: flagellar hook-associated protein 3 [Candidatus Desulfofervidus auxilii]|uniref:Flagellar hook-associated protein 3 n=1 Tax=Desulfofervidus auxilii TaxID=1621989 RepID=A0A7V0NEJ8_DESA2|nr:flagellar hook-associated protein 3 [Candidatus Desulfofervidus auxilii]